MSTIFGLLLLFVPVIIILFGLYRFYSTIEKEKETMFNLTGNKEKIIAKKDLESVPLSLKNYLLKVGVVGQCKDCNAYFKQEGFLKIDSDKKWRNFTATQYMTAHSPNFIWSARSYPLFIRDKCVNGEAEVKINLFGLYEVNKFNGTKINQSALTRNLGELIFYPIAFLSKDISWETQQNGVLKAKVTVGQTFAEGLFYFNEEGLLSKFEAMRYKEETLEKFTGIVSKYKKMEGLLIPSEIKAIWNLKDGDFEFFKGTITNYYID